jgi:hypothetical protein
VRGARCDSTQFIFKSKIKMDLIIISLPNALAVDLFSEWICTKSIAAFDTAVCSKEFRAPILKIISGDFSCIHNDESQHMTNSFVTWVFLRGVKLRNIRLANSKLVELEKNNKIFQINYSKVSTVILNVGSAEDHTNILRILNACVNLNSLLGGLDFDDFISKINPSILVNLKTLPKVFSFNLESIAEYCHSLEDLDIILWKSFSFDSLETIISKNKNLMKLAINLAAGVEIPDQFYSNIREIAPLMPSIEFPLLNMNNIDIEMTPLFLEIYHDSAVISVCYTSHEKIAPNIQHEIRKDARHTTVTLNPTCSDNDTILRLTSQIPENNIALIISNFPELNIETIKLIIDCNDKLRMICISNCILLEDSTQELEEYCEEKGFNDLLIVVDLISC